MAQRATGSRQQATKNAAHCAAVLSGLEDMVQRGAVRAQRQRCPVGRGELAIIRSASSIDPLALLSLYLVCTGNEEHKVHNELWQV